MYKEEPLKVFIEETKIKNRTPAEESWKIDSRKNDKSFPQHIINSIDVLSKHADKNAIASYILELSDDQQETLDLVLEKVLEEISFRERCNGLDCFTEVKDINQQSVVVKNCEILLDPTTDEESYLAAKKEIEQILKESIYKQ